MRMFKNKLRKIIDESGLTQEEFAMRTKVSRATLYNFCQGRNPTFRFILNLIEYDPEIDLNWLLKDKEYRRGEELFVVREDREESRHEYLEMIERAIRALKSIDN